MFTIAATDTETTGTGANDQVIQLAYLRVPNSLKELKEHFVPSTERVDYPREQLRMFSPFFPALSVYNQYYNPTVTINPFAQEIHGLSKQFLSRYKNHPDEAVLPKEIQLAIAHNAIFDKRFLKSDIDFICTYRLAQRIEKVQGGRIGFENYQLWTMFTYYYPELKDNFSTSRHCALTDCEMMLLVILKLVQEFPFLKSFTEIYDYFFAENAPGNPTKAKKTKSKAT